MTYITLPMGHLLIVKMIQITVCSFGIEQIIYARLKSLISARERAQEYAHPLLQNNEGLFL